jgi:hypothetical protein
MASSAEPGAHVGAHSLRELQVWLQAAITAPGGPARGPAVLGRCEELIRSGLGVGAAERVALYAQGYLARLHECLRADHPALRALVGDALFERFVVGYLWSSPSRSYDLYELGAGFAAYLERTRPPAGAVPEERRALLELPVDLVRVERARLEALRAPGLEHEARGPGSGPYELLLGAEVVVATAPCLRLAETRHDVRAFLAAVERGEPPEAPPAERLLLAVSRVDFHLTMTPLRDWQRVALECCAMPRSLPELASTLAGRLGEAEGAVRADLALWLPLAREQGLMTLRAEP